MTMITVGIDGSEQSRRALQWAVQHAKAASAAVQAVTVVDTSRLRAADARAELAAAERTLAAMVGEVLASAVDPPPLTYEVVAGDPTVVMVDATEHSDLIVFGSHRLTSLRRPALGTVSAACIRMGACPVLVIPVDRPAAALGNELVPA